MFVMQLPVEEPLNVRKLLLIDILEDRNYYFDEKLSHVRRLDLDILEERYEINWNSGVSQLLLCERIIVLN